jgi:hypothetical protein
LIGRTERFEFTDKDAPEGIIRYAVVFVTDPAETCGTCKSGAVLNYNQSILSPRVLLQHRIEDRCPLSMVEPMKSQPVRVSVKVLPPNAPPAPKNLRATSLPGVVRLQWNEDRPGQYQYNIYASNRQLNVAPILAHSFDAVTEVVEDAEYIVETVSKVVGGRSSITGKPLPVRKEPVFVLAADKGKLIAPATWEGEELNLSNGGYFVVEPNEEFNVKGIFSVECSVKFDEQGGMPVVVSNGLWNDAGWFLQHYNGRWRFHVGGVDCDGGKPKVGEWSHLVGTYDGEMLRLYENGKLVAEKSGVVSKNLWTKNLVIGQYSGQISPPYQVKGRMKDVRLWQRVIAK